jgi:endonuclease-3
MGYKLRTIIVRRRAYMNSKSIHTIFARFLKANPTPTTELVYHNDFELLIAVILSAQATDIAVNKATVSLFKKANTPEKMLALGEDDLKSHIKSIGLSQTKAKNVLATCQRLIDDYSSKVPDDREALESLPGVGRKTANVVLNTCFGHPTIAVDTHIFRVANRIGLSHGKTPLEVEKQLLVNVPKQYLQHAHHWLILHGRYVCKARKPLCQTCIIHDLCEYKDKTET